MPLPSSMRPNGPAMRLYDRYRFGDLAEIHLLDDRQYRDHHACRAALHHNKVMAGCEERLDPRRTMLGTAQEAWLADGLRRASTRWNVIGQQTLMAQVDRGGQGKPAWWHDGWDGYAPARTRLLDAVAASPVRDTLVLSGDVHAFWAADLRRDFDSPGAATVATEFVGGSITSQGPSQARVQALLDRNPHLRYGRSGRYGYALVVLDARMAHVAFRAVDTVKARQSAIATLQSFAVEAGRPGVVAG
jgi:alkaline phosphatase D